MSPSQSDKPPFEIYEYSIEQFISIICAKTLATKEALEGKAHISYFRNYFSHLDISAKTILVENDYIDHDYLDDYVVYYAKCFSPYKKNCTRAHFFSIRITEQQFNSALMGEVPNYNEILQNHYLGFIVLKPLPATVIGKTCLKTYRPDGRRRYYLSINTNRANLFGFELRVDSLPFQEQDSIVSACATSALWSAFNKTGTLFQHHIPSPSEITHAATLSTPGENRFFPNIEGLTAAQMAAAIRHVGLEPLRLTANNPGIFKRTLYAYIKNEIPVLLIFELVDTSVRHGPRRLGLHAVAITGYSLRDNISCSMPYDEIFSCPIPYDDVLLKAYCVDKIYRDIPLSQVRKWCNNAAYGGLPPDGCRT